MYRIRWLHDRSRHPPRNAYPNDRAHVFHSWSAQGALKPIVVAGAEGSRFWDENGKRYLDFSSQLVNVNIGHQHPKLVAAIQEQAAKLCTIAPFHANEARSEAARLITELAPGDLDMVFFTNGGAEATDNAIRMSRLHTGRQKVLSTYRSYHGATGGSIAVTGDPRRWASETGVSRRRPLLGAVSPIAARSTAANETEESERALQHLRETIMVEGAGDDCLHHARNRGRHQRHPGAAARLSARACARSATSTASSTSPMR